MNLNKYISAFLAPRPSLKTMTVHIGIAGEFSAPSEIYDSEISTSEETIKKFLNGFGGADTLKLSGELSQDSNGKFTLIAESE